MSLPIRVEPGSIEIEGIRGNVDPHGWTLYISTREKYVGVEVFEAGDNDTTTVCLFVTEETRRAGERVGTGEPTYIHLPGGYDCEASPGRYTLRVVARRTIPIDKLSPMSWRRHDALSS